MIKAIRARIQQSRRRKVYQSEEYQAQRRILVTHEKQAANTREQLHNMCRRNEENERIIEQLEDETKTSIKKIVSKIARIRCDEMRDRALPVIRICVDLHPHAVREIFEHGADRAVINRVAHEIGLQAASDLIALNMYRRNPGILDHDIPPISDPRADIDCSKMETTRVSEP